MTHHKAAHTSSTAIFLTIALLLSACSTSVTDDEWRQDWEAVLGEIPPLETMVTADSEALSMLCADTLGMLRTAAEDLQKTPDSDLETVAFTYLDFAEGVFFECPLHSGEHAGFEAGYAEMSHLQAAVEALLADS